MNIKILDVDTLGDDLDLEPIKKLGEVEVFSLTYAEDVIERIKDAEILILNKVKLNETNLCYAKNLKLICITATGYDNVDIEYCRKHNIAVCNVVGYSTDSVVQLTLSMVYALSTNLYDFDSYVKSGKYTKSGIFNYLKPTFYEMSGKTWGVVGLGNIGMKVARVAREMGCNVIVHKRTPIDEFECVDIDTLCEKSDIITLHTPLNKDTLHLINKERIEKMKDNVILVNVSRGAVVDEEEITKAVETNKIKALGVDVYSTEPMQENSPYQRILDHNNVIFTPHMAWGAIEARQRCIDEVSLNILAFEKGEKRCRVV